MVSESVTEQLNQIKREWTETTSKTITTHTGGAGMATKPHSLHLLGCNFTQPEDTYNYDKIYFRAQNYWVVQVT